MLRLPEIGPRRGARLGCRQNAHLGCAVFGKDFVMFLGYIWPHVYYFGDIRFVMMQRRDCIYSGFNILSVCRCNINTFFWHGRRRRRRRRCRWHSSRKHGCRRHRRRRHRRRHRPLIYGTKSPRGRPRAFLYRNSFPHNTLENKLGHLFHQPHTPPFLELR